MRRASQGYTVIEVDVVLDGRFGGTGARLESMGEFDVVLLGTFSRNLSPRCQLLLWDGLQLHRPIGSTYKTRGYVITRRYCEQPFARLQQLKWPIDHVVAGKAEALKPRGAIVQSRIVREDPELGMQSQIEPYAFRFDRLKLVETARRRLFGSRGGDLYSRLHRFL